MTQTRVARGVPAGGEFSTRAREESTLSAPLTRARRKVVRVPFTVDSFLERARAVHGDLYEYDESSITRYGALVKILCSTHGWFEKYPVDHMGGAGCKKCAMAARALTQVIPFKEFVRRAREVHGDKYEYSDADYEGSAKLVTIVCPVHKAFRQRPADHFGAGQGCPDPECSDPGKSRISFEEFVTRASATHEGKYEYHQDSYTQMNAHVGITCPTHGRFRQWASKHAAGAGCRDCSRERAGEARAMGAEEFLSRSRAIHGNRYEYDLSGYTKQSDPVSIICAVHGLFEQTGSSHISGKGCWECSYLQRGEAQRDSTDEYIAKAQMKHGDRYDYSSTVYTGSQKPVTIDCREHGPFTVPTAHSHAAGSGCPRCRESRGETAVASALEAAGVRFEMQWGHDTLRDVRPLRFDFALPDRRVLIEFDGDQHRRPVKWSTSTTNEEAAAAFQSVQRRDAIKTAWATANGWRLVRLSHVPTVEMDLIAAGVLSPYVGST